MAEPQCAARYKVVWVETPATDREITCLSCGAPLQGREGKFVLKWLRLQKADYEYPPFPDRIAQCSRVLRPASRRRLPRFRGSRRGQGVGTQHDEIRVTSCYPPSQKNGIPGTRRPLRSLTLGLSGSLPPAMAPTLVLEFD